jgi:hypothetical protein
MAKNNGGPAFPHLTAYQHDAGMTLRDYFAAKAMGSIIGLDKLSADQVADIAYFMADAMIAERDKE